MTFTTIYFVGAAVGAARGFYYLQEHKAELKKATEDYLAKARTSAIAANSKNAELLNDYTMELTGAAARGVVYAAIITAHTFAWPLVTALDIVDDVKLVLA